MTMIPDLRYIPRYKFLYRTLCKILCVLVGVIGYIVNNLTSVLPGNWWFRMVLPTGLMMDLEFLKVWQMSTYQNQTFHFLWTMEPCTITGRVHPAFRQMCGLKNTKGHVEAIMSYAFENGSGLQSIEIPSSVRLMTNHVFDGCGSLKDIYYGGTREEWENLANHYGAGVDETKVIVHCSGEK